MIYRVFVFVPLPESADEYVCVYNITLQHYLYSHISVEQEFWNYLSSYVDRDHLESPRPARPSSLFELILHDIPVRMDAPRGSLVPIRTLVDTDQLDDNIYHPHHPCYERVYEFHNESGSQR